MDKTILDPEKIIFYLTTQKGVSMLQMARDLGIERGKLASWKNSTKETRRNELSTKLTEIYGKMLNLEDIATLEKEVRQMDGVQEIEQKYIKLLETSLDEAKKEREEWKVLAEELRIKNEKLYEDLKVKINTLKE